MVVVAAVAAVVAVVAVMIVMMISNPTIFIFVPHACRRRSLSTPMCCPKKGVLSGRGGSALDVGSRRRTRQVFPNTQSARLRLPESVRERHWPPGQQRSGLGLGCSRRCCVAAAARWPRRLRCSVGPRVTFQIPVTSLTRQARFMCVCLLFVSRCPRGQQHFSNTPKHDQKTCPQPPWVILRHPFLLLPCLPDKRKYILGRARTALLAFRAPGVLLASILIHSFPGHLGRRSASHPRTLKETHCPNRVVFP